jgi:hypothetical protein
MKKGSKTYISYHYGAKSFKKQKIIIMIIFVFFWEKDLGTFSLAYIWLVPKFKKVPIFFIANLVSIIHVEKVNMEGIY